ncbi:MAG: FimV/HubP family polar landmark protein, partial [Halioglobus sp.]|nr:FimV/HubP family polar landmark protein [Halioglobus sp.]
DDVADEMAEAMPADAADELAEDVMQDVAEEPEAPAVMEQPVAEKPAAKPPAPAPEKSGGIMDYLWYIVGAAVLALLALLFLRRRGGDDDDYDADADDVFSDVQLGDQNLDVEEAVDSSAGDTAVTAFGTGAAAAAASGYSERGHDAYADDVEAADALAEADIYIAYGRHRQAVELLNNALANEPNNPVYRLKLMEIHTELNERAEASEQMHQLRSIGDQDSIARAEELMASFDAARAAPEAPQPAADAPAPGDEPGLAPNPLLAEDSGEMDTEFSGLAIEGSEEDADLDLSEDFTDDEEDELVIAADSNGMSTKLDLARAYIDMGDDDGARQILEEVVAEGSDELKSEAQQLLDRIG